MPADWCTILLRIAETSAMERSLKPTSVTSREDRTVESVDVSTVGGLKLANEAPWLDQLYRTSFRELAEMQFKTPVKCAEDTRISININVQYPGRRYEAHVDSNPIEGLLYVTDHPKGSGGELVVANNENAIGVSEIDSDASVVYPVAGHLVFFDARERPHYVRELAIGSKGPRVVVAMNFYTADSPESARPSDLNRHLFGED
ncbi:2OG-Fe(II) oxygenase [Gordonia sp. NPDC062954]|uniref:2OG-Fe(II) oxygenase n=1 Tax=Gordonia sp. NPDC062954 TaxID=3364003 RepID=UPI0037CCB3FC